jgi:hypothetical protein
MNPPILFLGFAAEFKTEVHRVTPTVGAKVCENKMACGWIAFSLLFFANEK